MMTARWCVCLASLAVAGIALSTALPGAEAAHPTIGQFAALDGGRAVVPHILVTALTVGHDGTIYAGGSYVTHNTDPTVSSPVTLLGSAWLVSHDHGATWAQHVSTTDPHAFPRSGIAPWRDHTMWPIDFVPAAITVDPHNPHVIYAAGCTDSGGDCTEPGRPIGGPLVLRSVNGGRSWQSILSFSTIVKNAALRVALRYSAAMPVQAYAVAVDPRTSQRLYVAVNGLGVLRSENDGKSWIYVTQPQSNNIVKPCELLIDALYPDTVYELAREGRVYRTTDAGRHWSMVAELGTQTHSTLSSLTLVGQALYVTAAHGIFVSHDKGLHWRRAYPAPMAGDLAQSIRGDGGWVSGFAPQSPKAVGGLFALPDAGTWQSVADTLNRGPRYYGSLDFRAMGGSLATRMWEDHSDRIIFTSGPAGGLFRWQSSL